MHRVWTVTTDDGVEHEFKLLLDAVGYQTTVGGVLRRKSWRA